MPDDFDSDDEAAELADARAHLAHLSKLEQLKGQIEKSADDKLDDCMNWVASAMKDNQGKRIVLRLTTADTSRAVSFGIQQRSKMTKLMAKFAGILPGRPAVETLRFEWQGQLLKGEQTPQEVGLHDGDTILVRVDG